MGSVIDYIDCPNCGNEAFDDFYYKTGEEYISCNHCGYYKARTIINRNKTLEELTDDDWFFQEVKNPYGAYRYKFEGDIGVSCGPIEKSEDVELIKYDLYEAEKADDRKIQYFVVSRFVDGKIVVENIIGSEPVFED